MTCDAIEIRSTVLALAEALHASAGTGVLIKAAPDDLSMNEAYAVQEHVFARRGTVAGWKLAVTSEAARTRLGLDCPVAGMLSESDILASECSVELPTGVLYAEAELAVTMSSDLPARAVPYDADEVASAIGPVHAAIELCASRYEDDEVNAPALIAANAFAYRLVLGCALAERWEPSLSSSAVTLDFGAGRCINGSTATVMGNPLNAVVWLANWLSSRGEGLKRGQAVATGSCTGVTEVRPGDTVRALFDGAEGAIASIAPRKEIRGLG